MLTIINNSTFFNNFTCKHTKLWKILNEWNKDLQQSSLLNFTITQVVTNFMIHPRALACS